MKCTQCTLTMCLVVAEQARWKQTGPHTRSWWNLGVFWCFNSKHGCVGRAGKSHEFTILWPPRNPHLTHLHMRDARLAEISTYDDFIGRAHSDSAHAHTHTHSVCFIFAIYMWSNCRSLLQILILYGTSLSPCGWTVLEWFNFCSILLAFWRAQAMRRFESSLQLISGIQQVRGCKSWGQRALSMTCPWHCHNCPTFWRTTSLNYFKLFHLESEKRCIMLE